METSERLDLMDVLLELSKISGEAFDMLEANLISEADVFLILQLPDWCNKFTQGIERHARRRVAGQDPARSINRTSYRGTQKG